MKWLLLLTGACGMAALGYAVEPDPGVLDAQQRRIEVVQKISPVTVAVFDSGGQGGGSGVVISPDGYVLTNFHVTASCGAAMKCGLDDGHRYDAVLVGIDPPGDVALIKMLGREDFACAELGDSDAAQPGDWVWVAGNPFLLAEDYTPTITYGILSGTHRYQYPSGTLLEYADCLQTDAAINPGNSGGPMFDAQGRLIGINGRGSFEKRGRVNVGVGYAISINQIKRFLTHLKAGRIVDHALLGATVASAEGDRALVNDLMEDSDVARRGLQYGDELLTFAGREIHSANAFKNALGTYPAGWRVPLSYRRDGTITDVVARLSGLHRAGELEALIAEAEAEPMPIEPPDGPAPDDKQPIPPPQPPAKQPKIPDAVAQVYNERDGFANYHFNREEQQRIARQCGQWQAFASSALTGMKATDDNGQMLTIDFAGRLATYTSPQGQFFAKLDEDVLDNLSPPGSGGLLAAIDSWRTLLTVGLDGYGDVHAFGQLPWGDDLQLHDVLVAERLATVTRFYFAPDSGDLVGVELEPSDDADPCEIHLAEFRSTPNGAKLPHQWRVRWGDGDFVAFTVEEYLTTTDQAPGGTP